MPEIVVVGSEYARCAAFASDNGIPLSQCFVHGQMGLRGRKIDRLYMLGNCSEHHWRVLQPCLINAEVFYIAP